LAENIFDLKLHKMSKDTFDELISSGDADTEALYLVPDNDIHLPELGPGNNNMFLRDDNTWAKVTPQNIGAAEKSHDHYIAEIVNLQDTLDGKSNEHEHPYLLNTTTYAGSSKQGGAATSANKVNKSITIKLNGGTTEGTNLFTFDGSAAKSMNITPASIGAAISGHTHDGRYYTEDEIDELLEGKADSGHTHPLTTGNWTIEAGVGDAKTTLYFKYNGIDIASLTSSGRFNLLV